MSRFYYYCTYHSREIASSTPDPILQITPTVLGAKTTCLDSKTKIYKITKTMTKKTNVLVIGYESCMENSGSTKYCLTLPCEVYPGIFRTSGVITHLA